MKLRALLIGITLAAVGVTLTGEPPATAAVKRVAKKKASRKEARSAYSDRVVALEGRRKVLSARYAKAKTSAERKKIRRAAKDAIMDAVVSDFLPAWEGTVWDFNGTTTTPGEGKIACGYYVTTLLRDAGLKVERARLAQQPAERIVKTLAPDTDIWRFRKGDVGEVLAKVHEEGEGLYVVGLDNHVGFLLERPGSGTQFCHASYDPPEAKCEVAAKSRLLASRYHVVGRVLTSQSLGRWLEGRAFDTVTQ